MARRSDHSREELKELALQAAEQIIVDQGLAGLSTRKVAGAIGYTAGSLYLVFENIDDLLWHLNSRTLDDLYEHLEEIASACDSPRACLLAVAQGYVSFANANRSRWAVIFEREMANQTPDWYLQKITQMFGLIENMLQTMLPHADASQIRDAGRALWSGVHGVCMLHLTGKMDITSSSFVQHLIQVLVDNFLDGLVMSGEALAVQ